MEPPGAKKYFFLLAYLLIALHFLTRSSGLLCYTGEANGTFTGPIAGWKDAGDFFTSLARWTAGDSGNFPGNMLVTHEVKNGILMVQLHLDPERGAEPFADLPKVTTLRGVAGAKPATEKTNMRWTSADTLTVEVPLRGNETALSTVDVAGAGRVSLSPVCLPYSPEFKPVEVDEGVLTLERLAKATGGKERINLAEIWKHLPRQIRLVELCPWLLILAILLFLLEVLERRTGLLSLKMRPAILRGPSLKEKPAAVKQPGAVVGVSALMSQAEDITEPEPAASEEKAGVLDALRRARHRAKERTERGGQ
jgi:hypothetical protein